VSTLEAEVIPTGRVVIGGTMNAALVVAVAGATVGKGTDAVSASTVRHGVATAAATVTTGGRDTGGSTEATGFTTVEVACMVEVACNVKVAGVVETIASAGVFGALVVPVGATCGELSGAPVG
jgi:2-iminoacetate synthase ThiH